MRIKRSTLLLSITVLFIMILGTALNVSATQMGGSIQGAPINIEPAGINTMAGAALSTGTTDATGTAARFYSPTGMTTDGANLYLSDKSNNTIRKIVLATGAVTTIAGSPLINTPSATGASLYTQYCANCHGADGKKKASATSIRNAINGGTASMSTPINYSLQSLTVAQIEDIASYLAGVTGGSGSADATGSEARFNYPSGITTDATNLYAADSWNSTIRKIVIATGAVTTIAGTALSTGSTNGTGTAARFYEPYGITTDGTNLYVADTWNNSIRKIVIATGEVTTIAGSAPSSGSADGTGSAARFLAPKGITTDGTNLYVADTQNSTLRKISIATGEVTTIAGSAQTTGSTDATGSAARFYSPTGLTTDGANLYAADTANHTIRKITKTTTYTLSTTSQSFSSTGGNGSITVIVSSPAASWTATSSLAWVTITSGSSGTGSGTVTISVSANTTGAARTGNITIAGQTVIITQNANQTVLLIVATPSSQTYFDTIQAAYNANIAVSDSSIRVQGVILAETLIFNQGINLTLTGGYDSSFSLADGTLYTTVQGSLTVSGGTVTVTNLVIQ